MSFPSQAAYDAGRHAACSSFGLTKEAFNFGQAAKMVGKGIGVGAKWLGRAASVVPVVGNAAGAVLSGIGGGIQGFAQGEGLKGALVRGGTQAASSLIPGGAGIAAGMAADVAANKLLAPKPAPGPARRPMPGMIGGAQLPGMVQR